MFTLVEKINVPISLTLARLILSPMFLPVFFFYFLPYNFLPLNFLLGMVFILFGLTDFLDGFLARKYNQETELGRILDPIADKFLIYSTLIAMLALNRIYFYWVVLLIGREFFMMSLRYVAVCYGLSVPVSYLGKVKTAVQMVFLTFLIVNPYHHQGIFAAPLINGIEYALLGAVLVLTYITTKHYYLSFLSKYGHGFGVFIKR
jgi:CDP-diacylglycerol--glycerol-3-phosphate 3-phosphatidyltransferase